MPPLRFGPQPLAGEQSEPRRAGGRQKPTARRVTEVSHSSMLGYRPFSFQSARRASPRQPNPSKSLPKPLPRRPRSCAAVKAAKRSQALGLNPPPLARKVPAGGKGSQTLSRKRPLSDDMRMVFDGAVSEAQHLERHAGCKGGFASGAICRSARRSTRHVASTRAGRGCHEALAAAYGASGAGSALSFWLQAASVTALGFQSLPWSRFAHLRASTPGCS